MTPLPTAGLYAVTDTELCRERGLVASVAAALGGGAAVVQYRDKSADAERRRREALALVELCRRHGAPLIVNDDVALARDVGADGVHLGRDDADVNQARRMLDSDAIIGVSCYHELARARAAERAGASYVAFGRFFSSRTKPGAPLATLELLRDARAQLRIPIAAIGGITADNGAALIEAGASMLAVVHGLFGAGDVELAARTLSALWD